MGTGQSHGEEVLFPTVVVRHDVTSTLSNIVLVKDERSLKPSRSDRSWTGLFSPVLPLPESLLPSTSYWSCTNLRSHRVPDRAPPTYL